MNYLVHHRETGEILFQGMCADPSDDDPTPHLRMATDPHHVAIICEPGVRYDDAAHMIDASTGKRIDKPALTPEQLRAKALRLLRARRNQILSASDREVTPDRWEAMSDAERASWSTYRQALRDLPVNTSDPANPAWPIAPKKE